MVNLATDPSYRDILRQCRAMLNQFGQAHADPLVAQMLADNTKPLPFKAEVTSRQKE